MVTSFSHPNLEMKLQLSLAPGCGAPDHSRKKLRLSRGEIVLLTGRSSELGPILQTSQVARGSVGCSCFRYCSLITAHYSSFRLVGPPAELAPFGEETSRAIEA